MDRPESDVVVDALWRRFTNPTDHDGRSAEDIDNMRASGVCPGEMLCPECSSPMDVRGGLGRARHFYHTRNNATRNCGGTQETAWHLACKFAAVRFGWSKEHTVDLPQGRRRADAFKDGQFLEFVHSLSDTYERKHRQLAENGIGCRWIVDSAASFHSPYGSEMFDFHAASEGTMRVRGLLRPKDACKLDALGIKNLFVYYRSAIWECIGHDEWQLLPQEHELQVMCTEDGGINYEMVMQSARGEESGRRVYCRPGLSTNWRTQVKYLIDEVFTSQHALFSEAIKILSARESRYFSAPKHDEYGTKEPVCKKGSFGRYLTHGQAKEIIAEAESRLALKATTIAVSAAASPAVAPPRPKEKEFSISFDPSAYEFRKRCELYGIHELQDAVEGGFVRTTCKWCGKFIGKRPVSDHRPLMAMLGER